MDELAILRRALELCCESRDRLTRFSLPPEHWIEEAIFEKENNNAESKKAGS